MGYHKKQIPKGVMGKSSKVMEELLEYDDAIEQGCTIMAQLELSDIYGALESLAASYKLTMDDLRLMSDITKSAFEDGSRRS